MDRTRRLVMTRVLAAPREVVFNAWTTPELLKQWFCPGDDMDVPVAEVDAREGGAYRIVMRDKAGETYSPSGTYEKFVPNEQLVFSWRWADSELVTRVTVDLKSLSADQTEMTLTHEGFPDADVRDRHNEGWNGCLARLSKVL